MKKQRLKGNSCNTSAPEITGDVTPPRKRVAETSTTGLLLFPHSSFQPLRWHYVTASLKSQRNQKKNKYPKTQRHETVLFFRLKLIEVGSSAWQHETVYHKCCLFFLKKRKF